MVCLLLFAVCARGASIKRGARWGAPVRKLNFGFRNALQDHLGECGEEMDARTDVRLGSWLSSVGSFYWVHHFCFWVSLSLFGDLSLSNAMLQRREPRLLGTSWRHFLSEPERSTTWIPHIDNVSKFYRFWCESNQDIDQFGNRSFFVEPVLTPSASIANAFDPGPFQTD